jgi:hypothetical protein
VKREQHDRRPPQRDACPDQPPAKPVEERGRGGRRSGLAQEPVADSFADDRPAASALSSGHVLKAIAALGGSPVNSIDDGLE